MERPLTIKQVDALDNAEFVICLSDGRVLMLTLAQALTLNPRVLPDGEPESN